MTGTRNHPAPLSCPACRAPLSGQERNCGNCGAALASTEAPTVVPTGKLSPGGMPRLRRVPAAGPAPQADASAAQTGAYGQPAPLQVSASRAAPNTYPQFRLPANPAAYDVAPTSRFTTHIEQPPYTMRVVTGIASLVITLFSGCLLVRYIAGIPQVFFIFVAIFGMLLYLLLHTFVSGLILPSYRRSQQQH